MKNKKMVATLASLCLIVVAVVAAVVGVLAAVQQNFKSTMSVTFTARNVSATVTLESMGPVAGVGTKTMESTLQHAAENYSVTFYPYSAAPSVSVLNGKDYEFGWNSDAAGTEFYGEAIYRFEIANHHTGHQLKVTVDIASAPSGLTIKYYSAEAGDLGRGDLTITRDNQSGSLTTGTFGPTSAVMTSKGMTLLSDEGSFYVPAAVTSPSEADGVMYIYMIVGLNGIASDITAESPNLANLLQVNLTDDGTAAA